MVCALQGFRIFSFDILMDVNDGSVWLPMAALKYQSSLGGRVAPDIHVASRLPAVVSVGGIIRTNWQLSA